jgi:nicotinamide-nucleotide amidase
MCGDFLSSKEHLEFDIGRLCLESKSTISLAESCTGGMISSRITDVPGSSHYFMGGIVVYSNNAKIAFLHIPSEELEKYGAVSAQTARYMADGVRDAFKSSMGLSVTGIAGPAGGTDEKPVGLVYIGIAEPGRTETHELHFKGDRTEVREQTTRKALSLLKEALERNTGDRDQELNGSRAPGEE